jgi:hypothetical protein
MALRSPVAVLLVLALAAALSAFTGSARAGGPVGADYVALGDSYAAGEGLGPYEPGTDVAAVLEDGRNRDPRKNTCHRSRKSAYGSLEQKRPIVLPHVPMHRRALWACSGATSLDMMNPDGQGGLAVDDAAYQGGQPNQVNTVDWKTRWISVGAGGNDVGFGAIGMACARIGSNRVPGAPQATCAEQVASAAALIEQEGAGGLRDRLRTLYTGLMEAAPFAKLAVVGYPKIFPSDYRRAKKLRDGSVLCVTNNLRVAAVGVLVPDAKSIDKKVIRGLNQAASSLVRELRADPKYASRIYYADTYNREDVVPQNCTGRTRKASVNGAMFSLGRGGGPGQLISTATFHPTRAGQTVMARAVQEAFGRKPPATVVSRQTPVTPDADVAPGFVVTESFSGGNCIEGSNVGQAYRCFFEHGVFDPCYAIAEPGTGDGTGVVCPTSPFSNQLRRFDGVVGLGQLDAVSYDEPNGIVLASGTRCPLAQGARGADTKGRAIDYFCDDDKTVVLRGLHKSGRLWTADTARVRGDKYVRSRRQPIAAAVLLHHDVPPANRPVTDAGNATADELDSWSRVHHEVDCGVHETTRSGVEERIFISGTSCSEASLIVTEWDNSSDLEPGWACTYNDAGTLLCQRSDSVGYADPPAFFSSPHIRALSG